MKAIVVATTATRGGLGVFGMAGLCALLTLGCDDDCDAYADEAAGTAIVMHVRNDLTSPLYLATNGCTSQILPFEVRDEDGHELQLQLPACVTCEGLQSSDGMCEASCMSPPTIYLAPGGLYELTWSGQYFAETEMPDSCYEERAQDHCWRMMGLAAGVNDITVLAHQSCTDGSSSGTCTCDSSAAGWCQLSSSGYLGDEPLEETATVDVPPGEPVLITFAP
ncbi:MAG: hypothetical protein DRI90_16240 [Deltaproteobacteria bacterium]|nr:MAG: hypothetical protein DRI90_16240 [Deltaproteobacteria bacterium]